MYRHNKHSLAIYNSPALKQNWHLEAYLLISREYKIYYKKFTVICYYKLLKLPIAYHMKHTNVDINICADHKFFVSYTGSTLPCQLIQPTLAFCSMHFERGQCTIISTVNDNRFYSEFHFYSSIIYNPTSANIKYDCYIWRTFNPLKAWHIIICPIT